jgi:hypothetical protein
VRRRPAAAESEDALGPAGADARAPDASAHRFAEFLDVQRADGIPGRDRAGEGEEVGAEAGAGLAVSIRGANVTISGCRFENNRGTALQVNAGGFVTAQALTFNGNVGRSMNVSDAQLFCTGCDVSGNNFAVLATRGAIVSLLDSVVTGRRGIFAVDAGTIADLDCATAGSGHPCVMKSSGVAAQANGGATVALVGAGSFLGQIGADDRGTVQLFGSRQVAGAIGGDGPDRNIADHFGTIVAAALDGPNGLVQSQLLGASAEHFSRVLITDATTLQGAIQCGSAADAWLDPTVVRAFGATVTGCDHANGR